MYKEKIKNYLQEHSSDSQGALAKKIGISATALNLYLSGKYPTPEALEVKIKGFFDLIETAGDYNINKPHFVETGISNVVINSISYCHIQKSMGIIYGDAGIGKTMAINEYSNTHPEALLVRAATSVSKPLSFLKLLSRRLKCSSCTKQDDVYLDLVDKLRGSEKIIIIDEAQHLPFSTLETIRDLHDECIIPIVLIGNKEVYSKLLGKGEAAFAQLFSRNAIRKELNTTHIQKQDIARIFSSLDMPSVEYLYNVSVSRWGIRGAVYAYLNAINNNDVTVSGLKKVVKLMGIAV